MSQPVDAIKAIRARLLGDATITGIVGDAVVAKGVFTSYEVPCVVLGLQGGETNRNINEGDEEEQNPEIQADCFAPDYGTAKQLHDATYNRLGINSPVIVGGHQIDSCAVDQPRDDVDPLIPGETIPDFLFIITARPWLKRV